MVSPSTAAGISANHSAFLQQSPVDSTRQPMQAASVSKQNTSTVPKLHTGSFQTFGDVLDSALWHPSILLAVNAEPGRATEAGVAQTGRVPTPQAQFSLPQTSISEKPEQQTPSGDPSATGTSALVTVLSAHSLEAPAQTYGIGNEIAPSGPTKAPDGKANGKNQPGVPAHTGEESPAPTTLDAVRSVIAGQAGEAVAAAVTSNTAPADQPQVRPVTSAGAPQMAAQAENANSKLTLSRSSGDSEAFCINLRAQTDLVQEGNFSNAPRPEIEAGTEPFSLVGLGQTGGGSDEKWIQNTPPLDKSGNVIEDQTAAQQQTSAVPGEPVGKSAAMMQVAPQGRRQPSPNGSEENNRGDKGAASSKPDTAMLKDAIGPPAASLLTPARMANASSQTAGSTRSGELPEMPEASAATAAKEMVVRFQGASGEVINVRLLDQGGQVQVAVRSSDPGTASQLRQDLTSLTSSLDRIGWKSETATAPALQAPISHDVSHSDSDSERGDRGSPLDWDEGPAKKRYATSELWDNVLADQNA